MKKVDLIKILNDSPLDEVNVIMESGDVLNIEIGELEVYRMKKTHLKFVLNTNPDSDKYYNLSDIKDDLPQLEWRFNEGFISDDMRQYYEFKKVLNIYNVISK